MTREQFREIEIEFARFGHCSQKGTDELIEAYRESRDLLKEVRKWIQDRTGDVAFIKRIDEAVGEKE